MCGKQTVSCGLLPHSRSRHRKSYQASFEDSIGIVVYPVPMLAASHRFERGSIPFGRPTAVYFVLDFVLDGCDVANLFNTCYERLRDVNIGVFSPDINDWMTVQGNVLPRSWE